MNKPPIYSILNIVANDILWVEEVKRTHITFVVGSMFKVPAKLISEFKYFRAKEYFCDSKMTYSLWNATREDHSLMGVNVAVFYNEPITHEEKDEMKIHLAKHPSII